MGGDGSKDFYNVLVQRIGKEIFRLQGMDISSRMLFFLFWSLLVTNVADLGTAQDEVKVARCKHHGPDIRFPFWLRGQQQDYPGFELSCNEKKDTVLILPRSVQLFVKDIDYKAQQIHVYDPDSCLPKQLPNLNISASAFKFPQDQTCFSKDNFCNSFFNSFVNFTLYNCSSREHKAFDEIPCLSSPGHKVYGFSGHYDGYEIGYSMVSCSKIADISLPEYVRFSPIPQRDLTLNWSKPMCSNCEANGQGCRLKNNSAQTQTECFNFNIQRQHTGGSTKLVVTGLILGSFLLALVIFGLYYVYQSNKKEKENQVKIKKFLEDYNASKPARYSYADIKRITNQFKDKVGQGGYGTVFKGSLSNDVLVAVKVLNNFKGNGEEFINEVGSMSRIHHINVARLVGFCADGYKRALVYEFLPNESLEKFIFSEKGKNRSLGYEKLQDIALGIAKGIEYLHQGCDQQILHFDIKPHNILLDHNFNPKISDFGLAKLCSKDQSAVSMSAARGTMGYIAPEVLSRNFGNVSHKSDVYSFGMLLLEMVGGRKNVDVTVESASQVYFPEWIYNNLEKGDELGIRIEDERHAKIARKLTIVGLRCIQWHPTDRPAMKVVVQMLEGEEDNLTMPPNPFASTDQMMMSATMNKRPFNRELAVISELE